MVLRLGSILNTDINVQTALKKMDFFVSSTAVIKQKTNQRSLSNMNKRSKRAQDNDIKQTPSADVIKKINNCHLSNVSV